MSIVFNRAEAIAMLEEIYDSGKALTTQEQGRLPVYQSKLNKHESLTSAEYEYLLKAYKRVMRR